jgi:hypothetical protein
VLFALARGNVCVQKAVILSTAIAQKASSRDQELVWWDDLEAIPQLEWDIESVIPHNGLVVVYGPAGSGKTFVVLDMAHAIATGRTWHGKSVRRGPAVYVFAEGATGLRERTRALQSLYPECAPVRIAFQQQTLQLLDQPGSIIPFADRIASTLGQAPSVIVIDTLSRNSAGSDENTQRDMSRVVAACDYLRERFGCTVILLHHTRRGDNEIRGNSVLTGAVDTSILVHRQGDRLALTCKKQRNSEEFPPLKFFLAPVGYSRAILPADAQSSPGEAPESAAAALQVLLQNGKAEGLTTTEWQAATAAFVGERSFYSLRKWLSDNGYVSKPAQRGRYRVTQKGMEFLQLHENCNEAAQQLAPLTAQPAGGYVIPPGAVGSSEEEAA